MPLAGGRARRTLLWLTVGLVVFSFVALDLLFALRP
jgi:hypothetical protein